MIIVCIVGVIILLSGVVAYSVVSVSKKADDDYEQLKRDILEEIKNS